MSRTTEPLTEPTSDTIAPGSRCGPIALAIAPHAPTGMQRITRSAPSHRLGAGSASRYRQGRARPRAPASRRRARSHDLAHGALRARRLAMDEPISPRPIMAMVLEQRLGHQAAPLPVMNAESASIAARFSSSVPMVMRKASGRPYSSTRRKMMRRSCRNLSAACADLPLPLGKMQQQEIRDARRHAKAEARQSLRPRGQPQLIVLGAALHPA